MDTPGTPKQELAEARTDWAEQRTEWAEDRTLLANERSFGGWMRTGLASVGVGLGFQAVFRAAEPTWMAKGVATLFIVIGVLIFAIAWRSARKLVDRLNPHTAEPIGATHLGVIAGLLSLASLALAGVLWWLI